MEFIKTYDGFEILVETQADEKRFQVGIDTPDGFFRFNTSYVSVEAAEKAIKESKIK